MANPKPGDFVEVVASDETVKGTLLQSPELEKDVVIIKLPSGYNIGIDKGKVKRISLLPQLQQKEKSEGEITAAKPFSEKGLSKNEKSKVPKISILHTGGTIASKVDYRTGGVTAAFSEEEMLGLFPELKQIAEIKSRKIAQMQSEMMRFPHYNLIAKEVKKEIESGADGVIVTHGTDTMHYTSAALAFILDNLQVPVILVGAQRSSDRGSTDAALNLISAAYFIANSDFCGVAICMHENMSDTSNLILPATKTRKMHTSRRDAFRPINTIAIARVDYEAKNITFFGSHNKKSAAVNNKKLQLFNEKIKVGVIKTHTNMFASEFLAFKGFDGLVVEGTGLGHLPNEEIDKFTAENKKIFAAVKTLIGSGTIVVMAPQTIYGRIQLNVYTPQREIQSIGVLGHLSDMTPETTFIKLAWLLSNYGKKEAKELITKNLRGEISERTEPDAFLV
ncbi:Glu-tRNA(Gln) amidotransferase subunit GatD [Candidatus Woesearchaeota archaeon]|nr:Glu-tRNA(Gln) amidotransferase subunit GatD [Candidatus Woesearchaeota archaeon]